MSITQEKAPPMLATSQGLPKTSKSHFKPVQLLKYTVFPNVHALERTEVHGTWDDFVKRIIDPATHSSKGKCPLFVMGTFGDKRSKSQSLRHAENLQSVTGVECDYDGELVSVAAVCDTLAIWGIRAVVYTSASHTPDRPRWRVVLPLTTPCTPSKRALLVGRMDDLLGGVLARESFTLSQSYYFGKVEGVMYEAHAFDGQCIDDASYLDADAIDVPIQRVDLDIDLLPCLTDEQLADTHSALSFLAQQKHGENYHDWVSVGQALKAASRMGQGSRTHELYEAFIHYSRDTPKFESDEKASEKWNQLTGDRSGIGVIFKKAQDFGWINPATTRSSKDRELLDVLISRKLADAMSGKFLFEHGGKGWLIYENGVWRTANRGEALEAAKLLGPSIQREAFTIAKKAEEIERISNLAKRAMTSTGIAAALKLAQSDPRLAVIPEELDRDPDLLNCRNGVLHLPTGELRTHNPLIKMSRQCPIDYVPHDAPRWLSFLDEISKHDSEWVSYVQRLCGYILTGHVREEVMVFMLGSGANGKSVFVNVLRRIMGNYSVVIPSGILMATKNKIGEAATPALATLPGARLALANEIESGSKFSAQTIKDICSTEPIAARANYGGFFSFVPTHKLLIRGNHKPIISDTDDGIWRRIQLLPFDARFGPDQKDMTLEDKLMSVATGILYWMAQGAVLYFRHGLKPPKRIAAETATYRKDSDLLGQWIDERAEKGDSYEWEQLEAYADYSRWCQNQGLQFMSKASFTRMLGERGVGRAQRGNGQRVRVYKGLRSWEYGLSPTSPQNDLFLN